MGILLHCCEDSLLLVLWYYCTGYEEKKGKKVPQLRLYSFTKSINFYPVFLLRRLLLLQLFLACEIIPLNCELLFCQCARAVIKLYATPVSAVFCYAGLMGQLMQSQEGKGSWERETGHYRGDETMGSDFGGLLCQVLLGSIAFL